MSSAVTDLTVAPPQRPNSAPYWAFFTQEDSAFWRFVHGNREALEPQASTPQHAPQSDKRFAREARQLPTVRREVHSAQPST